MALALTLTITMTVTLTLIDTGPIGRGRLHVRRHAQVRVRTPVPGTPAAA